LIGKTSPPKFLSEAREISVKIKKESSVTLRQEEKGIVDAVFVTEDHEGNKIIHVKTRDQRMETNMQLHMVKKELLGRLLMK